MDSAPITIKHAGFGACMIPDWIDPPIAAKLLQDGVLLAGPVLVFLAVRRGRTTKALLAYGLGAFLIAVVVDFMTFGWPLTSKFPEEVASAWCGGASATLIIAAVLTAVALPAGFVSRLIWTPKPH